MLNVGPAVLSESQPTIVSIAAQSIATRISLPSIFNLSRLELRRSLSERRWEALQLMVSQLEFNETVREKYACRLCLPLRCRPHALMGVTDPKEPR
jgi:hypothetical protein